MLKIRTDGKPHSFGRCRDVAWFDPVGFFLTVSIKIAIIGFPRAFYGKVFVRLSGAMQRDCGLISTDLPTFVECGTAPQA